MLYEAVIVLSLFSGTIGYQCVTPNEERAFCVSLFTCPVLLLSLGSLQPAALDFVKKSLCKSEPKDVLVCCGSFGNFTETTTSKPTTTPSVPRNPTPQIFHNSTTPTIPTKTTPKSFHNTTTPTTPTKTTPKSFHNNTLLASRKFCGYQHNDDRFSTDNSTALDEFPWLAHIVFLDEADEDPDQYLDRCNGVLINNRYVLTTEYCGTYAKSIKLGQYYTNATVACAGQSDCTEPVLEIPVVEEIHRSMVSDGWHDFALLRLASKVSFSDYIRPICLPLDESEVQDRPELKFSGWGSTDAGGVGKKRLEYKPTDISECEKLDDKGLTNVTEVTPVCLIPTNKYGELACTGDESGPLLYAVKRSQWFVDSLITRVYSKPTDINLCSNELPITGIKITMDIVGWIVSNMLP
ncbi:phenoloxidase-activating factor 1-like isoform X2 [Photinus pyralis]|uniref:phenoloxidase-activating factor 1-like isoform X2 n=1 Tax=Photinus pyralis TaxID=7054 RepID=UPI0012676015|nr:phenoloxidase-activating factor 1-like isoform X2 [Photinus pyralis]